MAVFQEARRAERRPTLPLIGDIMDPGRLAPAFQPIVDLESGAVVAVEALARWDGVGVTPDIAFAAARRHERVEELDLLCQQAAVAAARRVPLPRGFKVFVNIEPHSPVEPLLAAGPSVEVVAEVTERSLAIDPAGMLRSIRRLRDQGMGIALDDVGVAPDTLALLPFVAPDVVKLDLSMVQQWPGTDQARTMTAVVAYAERTCASLLAEGIETEAHLRQATALGATFGQGWYFGRPGPLGRHAPPKRPIGVRAPGPPPARTPFELLGGRNVRVADRGFLLQVSHHLESQGLRLETPPIVLSAFQDRVHFTAATARRYEALAQRCPLVVAFGADLGPEPASGVRGADLAGDDPLRSEWTVVVVGPHYTAALIARELSTEGQFEFDLTHDPDLVLDAARLLLGRVHRR